MTKRGYKLLLLAGCLLCLLALSGVALATESPIEAQIEISPTTLNGPGTVRVGISVNNVSEGENPVSVTLYDPNNEIVSGFSSGGTAYLRQNEFATYSGSWTVTQAQLEAGRIAYTVAFKMTDASGNQTSARKPISARITYQEAKPKLQIARTCPSSALEGQTVTVSYLVTNIGTVDATGLVIADPDITSDKPTLEFLAVGESAELSYSFVMGDKAKTTAATVSYNYTVGDKTYTNKFNCEAKNIGVATVGMIVELSAQTLIVNAGDKVELTCRLINKGDVNYSQLRITDPVLGDIDSGLSLQAGKTYEFKKTITVNQSGTYRFTVSGVDASGAAVSFVSNDQTIQIPAVSVGSPTTDVGSAEVIPVVLDVVIEADRDIIYEQPSDIVFHVKVTNNGAAAVENIVLSAAKKNITTIDSIAPGESYDLIRQFRASVGGQFQFKATAKDNTGTAVEFDSNIYYVTYQAPKPTAAPTVPPTQPPTAPPAVEPTDIATPFGGDEEEPSGMGVGSILLYVLAGLLVLILAAFVVLVVLDRRRNRPAERDGGAAVIDSMQRSSPRDYARAPKRAQPKQPARRRADPNAFDRDAEPEEDVFDGPAPDAGDARRPMRTYDVTDDEPAPRDDAFSRARPAVPPRVIGPENDDDLPPMPEPEAPAPDAEAAPERPANPYARPADPLAETQVYGSDYLSKFRRGKTPEAPAEAPAETPDAPEAEDARKPVSEEEASLLSGSTGQYKLTNRSASIHRTRSEAARPVAEQAENPEDFSRRQRAERAKRQQAVDFFSDEDDEPETPRRKP